MYPEPDLPDSKTIQPLTKCAIKSLKLGLEECGGGLELNLPWDPLAECVGVMTKCIASDKLPQPDKRNTVDSKAPQIMEDYHRYQMDDVKGTL